MDMNEIMQTTVINNNEKRRKYKGFFEKNSVLAPIYIN